MTKEDVIKLVSETDLKENSELIEFLGTLISPENINLENILKDEKFADLQKSINSFADKKVGTSRTEWDKLKVEEFEKLKKSFEKPEEEEKVSEFEKLTKMFNEKFEKLDENYQKLQTQKNVADLQSFAKAKLKDIPEVYHTLLDVTNNDTSETVTEKIEKISKVHAEAMANVNNTPHQGGSNFTSADSFITEKLAEINTGDNNSLSNFNQS